MAGSTSLHNKLVIQHLLQQADELTHQPYGLNSKVTIIGGEQYSTPIVFNANNSSNLNRVKIEEVDEATANHIIRSLSKTNVNPQYQFIGRNSLSNVAVDTSTSVSTTLNYSGGELFQDPNPPQVIRRPAEHGPINYRQNVSVQFLQPPPPPPPGPLIIKEVRSPQPPAPQPLLIRQRAPPLPTPPPIVLREQPPRSPVPIPTQTVIKKLPPIPAPPRSIFVEHFPAAPPRPRDVVVERWLPYSKEPQRRQVITHRAPPPCPYPQPRNKIIIHEPVQANVVRSVQQLGIRPQDPHEYVLQHGSTLLDPATLVAQARSAGVVEDLSPPLYGVTQHYQTDVSEYYINPTQTICEPEYEYSTTLLENPGTNNNEQFEIYWTDPYEDIHTILRRLGLAYD